MKKKKLLLIYPKDSITDYSFPGIIKLLGKKGGFISATLGTIAALTPPEYDVTIVDENVEPIDFDIPYDLVGITGFHLHLIRAKEIASAFSLRGVPVVCGGPSVTLSPERWRSIADVLIIGEAERIWPQFAKEFLSGSHCKEYRETQRLDLSISPIPDFSGYSRKSLKEYFVGIVQTSRGCPYDCEFCSVHVYLGHKMRYKPIDIIIQEVQQLHRLGIRIIFLADDNFSAGRKKASEILRALRDWNNGQSYPMGFITQLSIDTARDENFLRLAAEAGLSTVYIGIESPNVESLKEAGKNHNACSDMINDLKKFSQFGIQVIGSTVVGFDSDDISIFKMQFDFFMQTGISNIQVYPLQALDSTRLKQRMIQEKRYIDWEAGSSLDQQYKEFEKFTIIPKQMSLGQLKQGTIWLVWNLYKIENVKQRIITFLNDFESSPYNKIPFIPQKAPKQEKLKIFLRVLLFFFIETSAEEKKAFCELFRMARKSTRPFKRGMIGTMLIMAKNKQIILKNQYSQIDKVEYPR